MADQATVAVGLVRGSRVIPILPAITNKCGALNQKRAAAVLWADAQYLAGNYPSRRIDADNWEWPTD